MSNSATGEHPVPLFVDPHAARAAAEAAARYIAEGLTSGNAAWQAAATRYAEVISAPGQVLDAVGVTLETMGVPWGGGEGWVCRARRAVRRRLGRACRGAEAVLAATRELRIRN